jgi:hypothetical protein
MRALRLTSLLMLAIAALLPAAAAARPTAQPLVDQAPLGSQFKDRVTSSNPRVAHAAVSGKWAAYPTKEGTTVSAAISDAYGGQVSPQVAQSYVDFLDSLDHGPELSSLKIYIAPPTEVTTDCGGQEGTLACYDSRTMVMVVPGEPTDTGSSGVTTSYVVAHEYGHHIAAHRDNDPFSAFRFGPKYWASYELVCDRTAKGQLAPGNEQQYYLSNPGEGWAETYAQLKYPGVEWQYNPLMQPTADSFAAARQDVLNPWQYAVTKKFSGSFGKRGASAKKFNFALKLDGRLQVKLSGPKKSNYNLVLSSNGRPEGRTSTKGSSDSVSYPAACRESQLEQVTVAVKRVKGSGPFKLRVTYAG